MPAYRYVIVHFPNSQDNYANFCELEVYIRRKFLSLRDHVITCQLTERWSQTNNIRKEYLIIIDMIWAGAR